MKNSTIASKLNGAAIALLQCEENGRFRVPGSRVNVANVTCLTRGSLTFFLRDSTYSNDHF